MKVSGGNIKIEKGIAVVTIGMFDGVHRGHMRLLENVISRATATGGESVAITFEPHPRIVLSGGDINLRFLTSLDEKSALLKRTGLDHLIVLPFTQEIRMMSACDFVEKVLVRSIGLKHLVIGFDHHFGYRGAGDSTTLAQCAERFGFGVNRFEAVEEDGIIISSTVIRQLLEEGRLERANSLLGYDYIMHGKVVQGRKIGRGMGYPTANIEPGYPHKLIPADGVYAVEASIDSNMYKAMLYIGTRPTIESDGERVVEANLFGFDGDLYGKEISVRFRYRIRGDIKFSSRELLRQQISKDKEETLRLLG